MGTQSSDPLTVTAPRGETWHRQFRHLLMLVAVGLAAPRPLEIPAVLGIGFGSLLLVSAVWPMHSVKKYFGFARALGGDHIFERDRPMPLIQHAYIWVHWHGTEQSDGVVLCGRSPEETS